MRFKLTSLAVAAACSAALISSADDLADKGREIFRANQKVAVTVQLVVKTKISMPGLPAQDSESKKELTGTVVDPSGLTVVSFSAMDPGDLMQSMIGAAGDEAAKLKMDTALSEVKILLEDGTDLPAEIILRDQDMDLAFLRPKSPPASPMLAVDLTKLTQARVMDQVIALNRLGPAASRAYAVSVERITAIVQKPRLAYIPDSTMTATSMGCPAFTLDGNFLGLFVTRILKPQSGAGMMSMFNISQPNTASIILPAGEILKAAKQALEVKAQSNSETEKK